MQNDCFCSSSLLNRCKSWPVSRHTQLLCRGRYVYFLQKCQFLASFCWPLRHQRERKETEKECASWALISAPQNNGIFFSVANLLQAHRLQFTLISTLVHRNKHDIYFIEVKTQNLPLHITLLFQFPSLAQWISLTFLPCLKQWQDRRSKQIQAFLPRSYMHCGKYLFSFPKKHKNKNKLKFANFLCCARHSKVNKKRTRSLTKFETKRTSFTFAKTGPGDTGTSTDLTLNFTAYILTRTLRPQSQNRTTASSNATHKSVATRKILLHSKHTPKVSMARPYLFAQLFL